MSGKLNTVKHETELVSFGVNAGRNPYDHKAIGKSLADLKSCGLSSTEIAECVAVVAAFACITRVVDATGHNDAWISLMGKSFFLF